MQVQSLDLEDPLDKKRAKHSSFLPWEIPWAEEPGGLQTLELQRVGHGRPDTWHTLNISDFIPPFSC